MLKSIQSLRGFGIFDEYARPAQMKDFCDRNVIYGWNYSGKTTLSRLFHMLNERTSGETFLGCRFSLNDHAGTVIDETCIANCTKKIRVFNTDFIDASLNWSGKAFNPILLLGTEAQDAQNKITHFEAVIKRCNTSVADYRRKVSAIDQNLAEQRTIAAKNIKETLNIVEAFTATHLNMLLSAIASKPDENYVRPQEELTSDLSLATASEKDKLPEVTPLAFSPKVVDIYARLTGLLALVPTSSKVIDELREHPEIAQWVAAGLPLHEHVTTCQFCLNTLTPQRMAGLQAHFSKEVTEQRATLEAILTQLSDAVVPIPDIRESDLNSQFRRNLPSLVGTISVHAIAHNNWIQTARQTIDRKIKDPFRAISPPDDPEPLTTAITEAVGEVNVLIHSSNAISADFASSKLQAIKRLKYHYAQQFRSDFKLVESDATKAGFELRSKRFDRARIQAAAKMAEEHARINRAQNGREKINERIAEMLNSASLHIEVRKEPEGDKFILMRGTRIARDLSEGEKTAIAFAYFLTKLLEDGDLAEVIVYIDDPISSLDSNHIFQVYSLLKGMFFKWDKQPNTKGRWITICKQLFISTHNFEFFQLLHDLPGETNYYLTKRISSTRSTFIDLPLSVARYTSEYHYLFHILYDYHTSPNKADAEHLLALPNAARRFIELYTYAKLPLGRKVSVDERAERLFGQEPAARIMKVLHHFSHLQSIERLMANTNLVADIDGAVTLLMDYLKADTQHYEALIEAVTRKT